jgi:hypothetical protein
MTQVFCKDCKKPLANGTPRVVIDGEYVCGDCLYRREKSNDRV